MSLRIKIFKKNKIVDLKFKKAGIAKSKIPIQILFNKR